MFNGKFTLLLIVFILGTITQSYSQTIYSFVINGKKYEFVKEKKNWIDACEYAKMKGGYLIHIDSKEEQKAIYDSVTKKANLSKDYTVVIDGGGIAYIWIGATDKAEEGTWIWDGNNDDVGDNFWNGQGKAGADDGKIVTGKYVNWGGSSTSVRMEPDNYQNKQDAAAMALDGWPGGIGTLGIAGEWNDIDLMNSLYFIVEYDPKTETPKPLSPPDNETNLERKPLFTWAEVDADSYTLQVAKSSDFTSGLAMNRPNLKDTFLISDVKLDYNTKYYWRVNAVKGISTSDWSAVLSFTIKDLVVEKPILLSPAHNSSDIEAGSQFKWKKQDADIYSLQISKAIDFSKDIVVNKDNINDTVYSLELALESGVQYYWKVNAAKDGVNSLWSDPWSFKAKLLAPLAPQLGTPVDNAVNLDLKPTFTFSESNGAQSYFLLVSEINDLSSPAVNQEIMGTTSFTLTSALKENQVYYWGVKAKNTAGESPLSTIRKFTTKWISLINDNPESFEGFVSPNPATNFIEISLGTQQAMPQQIRIYDVFGREMADVQHLPDVGHLSTRIDISSLSPGLYFVWVGDKVGKFVKI